MDPDEPVAYVADADNRSLYRVHLTLGRISPTPLPGTPEQLVWVGSRRLAITLRDRNQVILFDLDGAGAATARATAEVATDPWGLAVTPEGDLLVTSAWGHALTRLDGMTLRPHWNIDLPREPRSITVSPDGARAFITHLVGNSLTVVDLRSDRPVSRQLPALGGVYRDRIDRVIGAGTLHPSAALAYAAALSESGTRLFVPHLIEQNSAATTHVVPGLYGGVPLEEETSMPSVAVIGVRDERGLGPLPLPPRRDDPESRALVGTGSLILDPAVGFAVSPNGSPTRQARAAAVVGDSLFVVSQGTGELVELDARSLDPAMDVRRRIPVGEGPTGLAVDRRGRRLVVWNQISHDITTVDLETHSPTRLPVADDPLPSDIAEGRRLFVTEKGHRISRDGRACAACHPEGRDDGLVWKLGAGPRQTPTLVGRLQIGPYGWEAKHMDLAENIRETVGRLGGQGISAHERAALASYLQHGLLAPSRSPEPTPDVARGRELFSSSEVGCAGCHDLQVAGSDHKRHDVGSRAREDVPSAFRTPPLRFVGATAPYFHDGRYATLEQLFENNVDAMGQTSQLSQRDVQALIAFLRSL